MSLVQKLESTVTTVDGRDGFQIVKYADGREFILKKFKGKKGTSMTLKLGKYVSGAFGGILVGVVDQIEGGTDVDKLDTVGLMLTGVLEGAFRELDDPKFEEFFYELFSCVSVDNKPLNYDEEFQGDIGTPFDLVRHIIMYNFAPVFQQLGIGALLKKKVVAE